MTTLASVQNLTMCYGETVAVNDVSFEAYAGEILAVIGPNGSGKSSTIECLEGLRRPTKGQAEVFGMPPQTRRAAIYQHLGVQLQDAQYPDKIKVSELCALFASFYDNSADWERLLVELDLEKNRKQYVSKLSGGEKQRLSVLLALLPKPKLLILDELTTGLDPEIRRSLWNSLKAIRQSGTGIILVSHYMEEVEALADRLVFLLKGALIYAGTQEGFKEYAKGVLPQEAWKPDMSLEDIYLQLVPGKGGISMEVLA